MMMWSFTSRIVARTLVRSTTPAMTMMMMSMMATAVATGTTTTMDRDRRFTPNTSVTMCDASSAGGRHNSRLRRKETKLQHAAGGDPLQSPSLLSRFWRRYNTRNELEKLHNQEEEILLRWERDEDGWRELPARAWPAYQPNPEQLKEIQAKISRDNCSPLDSKSHTCTELLFDAATALVFYNLDPQKGFEQYEALAKQGHVDSMVACGVILVEGMGIPPKEKDGIQWLQKAVDLNSAQGCYEMGTLLYTGVDGVLDEDSEGAFELFQRAASQDHTAGLYMMADCLLEGEGTKRNVGRAIPLLYRAAERGHRFARQRIRELLASYSSRPM